MSVQILSRILAIVMACGCTHSVQLEVVDAQTGAGVTGVNVVDRARYLNYFSSYKVTTTNIGTTDGRGKLVARGLRSGYSHLLTLSHPEHQDAWVKVGGSPWSSRGGVTSPARPTVPREVDATRPIRVELHRKQ
jgi:hypothetical protein